MTTSNLKELAAGLASLPKTDPQRQAAYRQAEGDPELMDALREGEKLMELLALAPPEAPSAQALESAAAAVLAQMDRDERRPVRAGWLEGVLMPLALLFGPAIVVMMDGFDPRHPQLPLAAGLLAVTLLLGATATLLSKPLLVLAIAAGTAFVALATNGSLGSLHGGAMCLAMTLVSAIAPLALAVTFALRGHVQGGSGLFGGVAALGALSGMAAMHLHCPGVTLAHLGAFHLSGVLLAGLGGVLVGRVPALRRVPMAR